MDPRTKRLHHLGKLPAMHHNKQGRAAIHWSGDMIDVIWTDVGSLAQDLAKLALGVKLMSQHSQIPSGNWSCRTRCIRRSPPFNASARRDSLPGGMTSHRDIRGWSWQFFRFICRFMFESPMMENILNILHQLINVVEWPKLASTTCTTWAPIPSHLPSPTPTCLSRFSFFLSSCYSTNSEEF